MVATDPILASNGLREGLSEQEQVQWKVFSELDTQDEADMMALAGFFQALSGTFSFEGCVYKEQVCLITHHFSHNREYPRQGSGHEQRNE